MSTKIKDGIEKKMIRAVTVVGCAGAMLITLTAGTPLVKQQDINLKEKVLFIGGKAFALDTGDKEGVLTAVMQHPTANTQPTVSFATGVMKECEPFQPKVSMVAHNVPLVGSANPIETSPVIINDEGIDIEDIKSGPAESEYIDSAEVEPTEQSEETLTEDVVMDVYELKANGLPAGSITNTQVLLQSAVVDPNYTGQVLHLTGANRDNFERLVMGEAGDEGFEGAALVAQALKDTMLMTGNTNTLSIKSKFGYSGRLGTAPNSDVKRACSYILDEGGSAVQHRIIYFYAPRYVRGGVSKFHESQQFVIEYGGHRVFDMR